MNATNTTELMNTLGLQAKAASALMAKASAATKLSTLRGLAAVDTVVLDQAGARTRGTRGLDIGAAIGAEAGPGDGRERRKSHGQSADMRKPCAADCCRTRYRTFDRLA